MENFAGLVLATIMAVAVPAGMASATYFYGGNDREDLNSLRNLRLSGGALSEEERAVLQLADRTGSVLWPDCIDPITGQPVNGNAFLIQIEGRDAILTSAHFIKNELGRHTGGCVLENFLRAEYMPNISLYNQTGPSQLPDELLFLRIPASVDPRFGSFSSTSIPFDSDWLVLFPDEPLSTQVAPNQDHPRGFISFAAAVTDEKLLPGFIIGEDSRQEMGVTTWQPCEFVQRGSRTYHNCDTYRGSSGSPIGVLQDGEIRLQSLNNETSRYFDIEVIQQLPTNFLRWNQALSASHIQLEIQRIIGNPPVMPFELEPAAPGVDL